MLAEKILTYYNSIEFPKRALPSEIEWIKNVFNDKVKESMTIFYHKYYQDQSPRKILFGINPGRFGAGVTGIPFTDPINLQEKCAISNNFQKRHELSSKFIYDVIEAFGGPNLFFSQCYITSISPLGFIQHGKNINYYDDKKLQAMLWKWMKQQIKRQLDFGMQTEVGYSIGSGKNLKVLKQMNEEEGWFGRVESLPHPRWVMQYRLKRKQEFIDEYLQKLF